MICASTGDEGFEGMKSYMFYNNPSMMAAVIGSHEERYAPQLIKRAMPAAVGMWCQARLEVGNWHRKHLSSALQNTKLSATLHLQCSSRSMRWWRIAHCIC